jgi:hypothetical protein
VKGAKTCEQPIAGSLPIRKVTFETFLLFFFSITILPFPILFFIVLVCFFLHSCCLAQAFIVCAVALIFPGKKCQALECFRASPYQSIWRWQVFYFMSCPGP